MENQNKIAPPKDLAGYQHVVTGLVQEFDILVYGGAREKIFARALAGLPVANQDFDVYRKMPCPKAGDHDKAWKNAQDEEKLRGMAWFGDRPKPVDFGKLQAFPSGSKRQDKTGKGRFDLIPYEPTRQLAVHFEEGGRLHGDRNWELGQPLSTYLSAAKRHAAQAGNVKDENHAISSCWNFFCLIQTAEWIRSGILPKELDDIGWLEDKPKSK